MIPWLVINGLRVVLQFTLSIAVVILIFNWPKCRARIWCITATIFYGMTCIFDLVQIASTWFLRFNSSIAFTYVLMGIDTCLTLLSIGFAIVGIGLLGKDLRDFRSPKPTGHPPIPLHHETGALQYAQLLVGFAFASLFFWPLGIFVRIASARSLKRSGIDEESRSMTRLAYNLSSLSSILLVSVTFVVLMLVCVLTFDLL